MLVHSALLKRFDLRRNHRRTVHHQSEDEPRHHQERTKKSLYTPDALPTRCYDACQVQEGDSTDGSPMGLTIPNDENASVILPHTALLSRVVSPQILQKSSRPSLAANLTLLGVPGGEGVGSGLGIDGESVAVDTTLPALDTEKGVEVSGDGNGTYTYGDAVFITVW